MRAHLQKAIDVVGHYRLAKACGLTGPAIYKWLRNGRLPRTEWTGETNYASIIEEETGGVIKKEDLLGLPASKTP